MAIPKINEEDITAAIKYIEENGVPEKNKSSRYVLVTEEGKQYPPKYVIAVANHLANGVNIITDGFNAVEAKNYFETRGYNIESKQEKYELTITAKEVSSTDERFTMKLDIENPIIRINTAFKGCSSLEKISVLPRIYHN